jgi:polysaccharide lyase family 4-like protein
VARALPFTRPHTDRSDHHVTVAPPRATAPRCTLLLASLLLIVACGDDTSGGFSLGKKSGSAAGAVEPELKGPVVIATPKEPYTRGQAGAASLSGVATASSAVPAAAPIPTGADSLVCGATVPDSSVQQKGSGLGNVVVWLEGIRTGKPLPLERRLELESFHCLLTPRVQAAVIGSAVNVLGHDPFRQHLLFLAAGDSARRATILLGKDEQVIPTELPAKSPGLVIVRDADHAWPRAYLAVFDHPYFAVTRPDGSFRIDGVPAGRYTLVAWHERAGRSEQTVNVPASGETKVAIPLTVR